MSSMQQMNYLQNLVTQANKLKIEQENRQRDLAMAYETKVRQANMSTRSRQAALNTSSQRTLVPRKKPLVEPDLAYTEESVSGISALYQQAKSYDPLKTTKTEKQLTEPLTYFNTLKQDVSSKYQNDVNALKLKSEDLYRLSQGVSKVSAREQLGFSANQKLTAEQEKQVNQKVTENYNNLQALSNKYGIGALPTTLDFILNPPQNRSYFYRNFKDYLGSSIGYNAKLAEAQKPINTILGRLDTINKEFFTPQQTTLSNLIAEQEKYYGKDFANVDKKILSVADFSGFNSLKSELEKYTELRNVYIDKYKNSGSQWDKDKINDYNKLIIDTQKNISSEIPKILTAAQKTAGTLQSTTASTLSTLEALNKTFGERGKSTVKPTLEQRKVIDLSGTSTNANREQVIARMDRVGSYLEKSKPAPKFESRPT